MITFLIFYILFSALATYGFEAERGKYINTSYFVLIPECLIVGWCLFPIILGRILANNFK